MSEVGDGVSEEFQHRLPKPAEAPKAKAEDKPKAKPKSN